MSRTLVIAEAGVNHNGSLDLAFELIDAAKEAGADAVKFQTFTADGVVTRAARKAEYQQKTTGASESQYDMIARLELDANAHEEIVARCNQRGIPFMSTPFDVPSLDLLLRLGVQRLKIASGEITNRQLLRRAAASGLPIILSTGMSTLADVEAALGVLASGYLETRGLHLSPGDAYIHRDGQAELSSKVTILHCTTEYPAPFEDVNLRAMLTMREAFGLPVGYSDHTEGVYVAIAAVALGATLIEKHFTMSCKLPGPDHAASLEPAQLGELVRGVRAAEAALGSPRKAPAPSELKNRDIARRSLVAATHIRQGERFTEENLTAKRPGAGVSPMRIDEWLGKRAARDYAKDELITE